MTASLRIQSSKADSNTWESFTRSELKLESVHQESPRSDIFRKRATKHFWNRNIVRTILPGLRRKITGLLLSGPKSSFQMRASFVFRLEIKVPASEEEWRGTESIAWGPVCSFHSPWWFGLQYHLLVLFHLWGRESMEYCQEEDETPDPTMQMTWRMPSKQPELHYTSAVPQTDHLHATPHWWSNSCKRRPNQVLSRNEHTDISVENILFVLILFNILIFGDTEFWVFIICKP